MIKKEFKMIWADKGNVFFLFLMPLIFIVVMNTALSGSYTQSESEPIRIPVLNLDEQGQSNLVIKEMNDLPGFEVEEEIEDEPITREELDDLIKNNKRKAGLVFPQDFSEKMNDDEIPEVLFIVDPATGDQVLAPIEASIQGVILSTVGRAKLEKSIEQGIAELSPQFAEAGTQSIKDQISHGFEQELITFSRVYPEDMNSVKMPSMVQQHIPGYAIMFVFFIMTGIVESFMDEKVTGSFNRIVAAPVSKAGIIIGKFFPYYVVNVLQLVVMFTVGVVFYEMEMGQSFTGLLLVTLTLPLVSTAMGMFVSTIIKTKNQGTSIAVITTLVLSAFGGLFIPIFILPEGMQLIARHTPMGAALMGYQDVIVRGLDASAVFDNIGILGIYAVVFFVLAVWRFKFEN